jgi:hypothetical protein
LDPDCIGPIRDGFFVQLDQLSAILACAILAGLTVFQGALIGGAPLGRMAWAGQHEVLPARLRIGSAVSIALYALFAYAALAKAGLAPPFVNKTFTSISMWVLTGYFSLGIVLNLISRSKPERLIMTPTVLVLAALYLVLALS